ncbi:glycosyltransferase [uncultured Pseudokineococcus sp.]|uniref:glycosyltransferase n=1 Tax=uncultured Pseudokineococcus sp. TaxID=1642928 RepID=UPI00262C9E24|nr:glycosyltransferase [uncultured Pseudokineococcus sp.]
MRVLLWHVHGSWTTSFVQGSHTYLLPVLPDRGPDGRGRARTWSWPGSAVEVTPEQLAAEPPDVVVLQRAHEAELLERWTGLVAGVDVPVVHLEHDAPTDHAARSRQRAADGRDLVVHVTAYNALMWDNGGAPTTVVEHGVVDPGPLATGERRSLGVVVNEPVRRERVAGTDVVLDLARSLPVEVYGMGMAALGELADARGVPSLGTASGALHDDLPQDRMHSELGAHRAYLHPYRWTSLGMALCEAMTIGMPVLAVASTAAADAVPAAGGVVSADPRVLARAARTWLEDPAAAREAGAAAREHALARFGLARFLREWDEVLDAVVAGDLPAAARREVLA